jgi:hypothetical protein
MHRCRYAALVKMSKENLGHCWREVAAVQKSVA